jgi:hypothetical protein
MCDERLPQWRSVNAWAAMTPHNDMAHANRPGGLQLLSKPATCPRICTLGSNLYRFARIFDAHEGAFSLSPDKRPKTVVLACTGCSNFFLSCQVNGTRLDYSGPPK